MPQDNQAREPQLPSLCFRARVLHQRETHELQLELRPCSPQLERARAPTETQHSPKLDK